jgi:hypothetical protein
MLFAMHNLVERYPKDIISLEILEFMAYPSLHVLVLAVLYRRKNRSIDKQSTAYSYTLERRCTNRSCERVEVG